MKMYLVLITNEGSTFPFGFSQDTNSGLLGESPVFVKNPSLVNSGNRN